MTIRPRHADPYRLVEIKFSTPPPEPEPMLQFLLRTGRVFLNGPDRPVPIFAFLCAAPDVEGYVDDPASVSVLLNGKRIARIHLRDGVAERTENFDPPQDVEDGSIVLWPWPPDDEP